MVNESEHDKYVWMHACISKFFFTSVDTANGGIIINTIHKTHLVRCFFSLCLSSLAIGRKSERNKKDKKKIVLFV